MTQQHKPLKKGSILYRIMGRPGPTRRVVEVHTYAGGVDVRLEFLRRNKGVLETVRTPWLPVQEDGLPAGYRRETEAERKARLAARKAGANGSR